MAGFTAPEDGNNAEPKEVVEAGVQHAICIGVADIGTHMKRSETYGDKKKRMINLQFELVNVRDKGEFEGTPYDRRRVVGKKMPFSMHEKANLRKFLSAWRGKALTDAEAKAFDVAALVGKPVCLLFEMDQSGEKSWPNGACPAKGMPDVAPESPLYSYSIDRDGKNFPVALDQYHCSWVKSAVMESDEGLAMACDQSQQAAVPAPQGEADQGATVDEDIPF